MCMHLACVQLPDAMESEAAAQMANSGTLTKPGSAVPEPTVPQLPETEAYASLLVLLLLTDGKHWAEVGLLWCHSAVAPLRLVAVAPPAFRLAQLCPGQRIADAVRAAHSIDLHHAQAKEVATAAVQRLGSFNRRTLDVLAARIYSYLSLTHERTGTLSSIRRWASRL